MGQSWAIRGKKQTGKRYGGRFVEGIEFPGNSDEEGIAKQCWQSVFKDEEGHRLVPHTSNNVTYSAKKVPLLSISRVTFRYATFIGRWRVNLVPQS